MPDFLPHSTMKLSFHVFLEPLPGKERREFADDLNRLTARWVKAKKARLAGYEGMRRDQGR